jgi:hypothetical protein
MAPRIPSTDLQSRAARTKARQTGRLEPRGRPYCVTVAPGVRLGYRCTTSGDGTWVVVIGRGKGASQQKQFAVADDRQDSNGSDIMTYLQAVEQAQKIGRGSSNAEVATDDEEAGPLLVERAVTNYENDLIRRGGYPGNATRISKHLPDWLKRKLVSLLTMRDLTKFCDHLLKVAKLTRGSVNRTMNAFKAALNLAARQYPDQITNADAWRNFQMLGNADRSNNIIFNDLQVSAVVRESFTRHGERYGTFVWVHAETGARTKQIAMLRVDGLLGANTDMPELEMPCSLKGKNKEPAMMRVQITVELAAKLVELAGNRAGHEPLLVDDQGCGLITAEGDVRQVWEWYKAFPAIAMDLKLPTSPIDGGPATIYALRHSSIVRQIMAGLPIRVVATNHDTSVAMIEKTYSKWIRNPAAEMSRRALPALAVAERAENIIPMKRK